MKVGLTFNVKKENDAEIKKSSRKHENIIDDNLLNNYSERLSDKYAEWDDMETIDAIKNAISSCGDMCKNISVTTK